jgi:hypothetical protein
VRHPRHFQGPCWKRGNCVKDCIIFGGSGRRTIIVMFRRVFYLKYWRDSVRGLQWFIICLRSEEICWGQTWRRCITGRIFRRLGQEIVAWLEISNAYLVINRKTLDLFKKIAHLEALYIVSVLIFTYLFGRSLFLFFLSCHHKS